MKLIYQPLVTGSLDPVDVARFAGRVDLSAGLLHCWPWTGELQGNGYGRTSYHRRTITAHRFALELHLGRRIRPGMYALHSCDNPPCVNPLHLREGTPADNTADMMARDRHRKPPYHHGAHAHSTMTESLVREARARAEAGETIVAIARSMGRGRTAVSRAVARQTWNHVQ